MRKNAELLLLGTDKGLESSISTAVKGIGTVRQTIPEFGRHGERTNGVPNQIVLVAVDADPEAGFRAVSALSSKHPGRPVIVLSQSPDSNQVLRAMRAGARDYAII